MRLTWQLRTPNNGFTLIEILVAVSLSAIVITLVYTSLFQIIQTKDRVEETSELAHEVRVLFSRIEKDITNAYPRGGVYLPSASDQTYFLGTIDGENSKLIFTTFARDTVFEPNQSDQTEVTYFLLSNEDEDGLYSLFRRDNPFQGNENGGFVFPISEKIVKFELFYTDENSFEILKGGEVSKIREWNSSEIGSFPKAVEVNVTFRDKNNDERNFTNIFLIPVANS